MNPSDESVYIGGRFVKFRRLVVEALVGSIKGWFHEPTNHDDERDKTAGEWKLTKNNRSL